MTERCEKCDSGREDQLEVSECALIALLAGGFTIYLLLRGPETASWILPVWVIYLVTLASGFIAGGAVVLTLRLYVHQRRHHR